MKLPKIFSRMLNTSAPKPPRPEDNYQVGMDPAEEEAELDKEIEAVQEDHNQQMNQIVDNQMLSMPPSIVTEKEPSPPPKKEFLMHSCVVCEKFQGVTLYNINYKGLKRKACEWHKSHYPKWVKGSMGFN